MLIVTENVTATASFCGSQLVGLVRLHKHDTLAPDRSISVATPGCGSA
ncbi:hypothetical protein VSR01_20045 [Actinacidiphila sp. DG2A-62]|nr:hypothetical protein [Actinacidiphila sp. DG2A-62]MEC3995684.1 hypothetical protein [Actinacidiphila sp. DG2A-62]